ncbi:MAG: class I SAM-dependent methyltransferase [Cyclobacteriaceae bacterium]|nr:class I SAM-dependent methyltransferase [Cyclobacteriaceae bacterium]
MTKLVTKEYWEEYYSGSTTTKLEVSRICSVYDSFWEILVMNNSNLEKKSIIEIGGYPGRYLAYLAAKFELVPTCLDFNSDKSKIDATMAQFDIENYTVIQADLFDHSPKEQYDIVISNGFVEHFKNFDTVMDKHIKYLKRGGTMLMMIPNMRGYIKWYKTFVDKPNLQIHNLECMSLNVFSDFGKRHNLEVLHLGYFGSFPFNVHQKLNGIQSLVYNIHRIVFKKLFNRFLTLRPNALLSSSIIAIYKNGR